MFNALKRVVRALWLFEKKSKKYSLTGSRRLILVELICEEHRELKLGGVYYMCVEQGTILSPHCACDFS